MSMGVIDGFMGLPEENVDFFVENVQRENAHAAKKEGFSWNYQNFDGLNSPVVFLNRSGRTIFVERTLRNSREDLNHRIRAILLIHVREADDISSICEKTSAEKFVDHDDVDNLDGYKGGKCQLKCRGMKTKEKAQTHHIENVQKLAEEVSESVGVVSAHAVDEVSNQALLTASSFSNGHCENASKAFGDHAHLALFPVLPDPVGNVEH
jgi:hypothetical protein